MSTPTAPRIAKWPFFLGDLLLLGLAGGVAAQASRPLQLWEALVCLAAVVCGAWLAVLPFLRDHQAGQNHAEALTLAQAADRFSELSQVQEAIATATARWQGVQEAAAKTLAGADEIAQRMSAQTQEFQTFFQRASDQERSTLRLEIDKLRRAEGEWLQVLVRILDHTWALHQAGVRSGKPELIHELTMFQNACRDAARRIGLIALVPVVNEPFDPRVHQTPESPERQPAPGTPISGVLATGFTFQAQLVRRALVETGASATAPAAASEDPAQTVTFNSGVAPDSHRPADVAAESPASSPAAPGTAPQSAATRTAVSSPDQSELF